MKKILLGVVAILSVGYVATTTKPVQAEEICNLSEKYKIYAETIKTGGYSDESIKRELAARKELLRDSISCAALDVSSLKEPLLQTPANTSNNLRENLLSSLDEAAKYYEQKKSILNELGIQGVKDTAKEIYAWRENNFSVLAKRVKNYLVWQENQLMFTKTEERLRQINNLISSLKMIEDSALQDISRKATNNLLNAKEENTKTKINLERNLNSDEVLSSMKKSLEHLSGVYGNFLEISDRISEIIPRNKK